MYKPFLTKTFQSLPVLIALSSPLAFAQHGSVNGPVTSGSLNPASGATVIGHGAFEKARSECYEKMFLEMYDPFLATLTPQMNVIQSETVPPNGAWSIEGIRVTPTSLNQSPLAVAARNRSEGSSNFGASLWVREDNASIYQAYLTIYGATSEINRAIFPIVLFEDTVLTDYDPITNAPIRRYRGFKNLRKSYGIAPVDEAHIPIVDIQNKPSNLQINGKQFFECLESKL